MNSVVVESVLGGNRVVHIDRGEFVLVASIGDDPCLSKFRGGPWTIVSDDLPKIADASRAAFEYLGEDSD